MPFLPPNQQRQSTEGTKHKTRHVQVIGLKLETAVTMTKNAVKWKTHTQIPDKHGNKKKQKSTENRKSMRNNAQCEAEAENGDNCESKTAKIH